jgi:phosphoribosylformimino-5-aminoimidazole carboxamide ribonucleotide (ProFAR) isomerase
MQLKLNLLRQRLGQFGLNPLDWCVEIRSKHGKLIQLEITALTGDMRIDGWAENGNWLSLALDEF